MTAVPTAYANAQEFHAKFSGFNEIGALGAETGAILSNGEGTLKLKLDKQLQSITFTLTYTGMATAVTQAHIHSGKVHVAGGIIAFLCSNLPSPPARDPAMPGEWRHRDGDAHARQRDRARGTKFHTRQLRRTRGRVAVAHRLWEHPYRPIPGRRNPRRDTPG
jgi:CHRD domain